MFNVSSLVNVSEAVLATAERPPDDVLVLMLPVIGISVVLFSLGVLAFVLTQFVWIDKIVALKDKLFLKAPAKEEKKELVEKGETGSNIMADIDDDEITAAFTALHLFIQDKTTDPVILTEHLIENSGWVTYAKTRQNAAFDKWHLNKKR